MTEFEQVSVVKKANVYFDGKVSSRTLKFADGSMKTLGFMLPGEYRFNTADKELMEVIDGELQALLPGSDDWQVFNAGEAFYVPANSQFSVKAVTSVDYCCSFISEEKAATC